MEDRRERMEEMRIGLENIIRLAERSIHARSGVVTWMKSWVEEEVEQRRSEGTF